MSESEPNFVIRLMRPIDIDAVVELQKEAFPPPFPQDYHWDREHLLEHLSICPEIQWVAVSNGSVIGSCSNAIISEANWLHHGNWYETVGGPELRNHEPTGTTLYGLDITVRPSMRRQGVGRAFYQTRFNYVASNGLARFATGCRMPDYSTRLAYHPGESAEDYVQSVVAGRLTDRVVTPLLKMRMKFVAVAEDYMQDEESRNYGVLLEGPV